jgi:hypothetical protein
MASCAPTKLTPDAIDGAELRTIAHQQQPRRHLPTDPREDRDDRINPLHRPEVRNVNDDFGLLATGKPPPQLRRIRPSEDRAVQEVWNDRDASFDIQLGTRRPPQALGDGGGAIRALD